MSLSLELENAGYEPVHTPAKVHIDKMDRGQDDPDTELKKGLPGLPGIGRRSA